METLGIFLLAGPKATNLGKKRCAVKCLRKRVLLWRKRGYSAFLVAVVETATKSALQLFAPSGSLKSIYWSGTHSLRLAFVGLSLRLRQ